MLNQVKNNPNIIDKLLDAGYNILDIPDEFPFSEYHLWLRNKEVKKRKKEKKPRPRQEPFSRSPTLQEPLTESPIQQETHIGIMPNIPYILPQDSRAQIQIQNEKSLQELGFDNIVSYDDFVYHPDTNQQDTWSAPPTIWDLLVIY